MSIVDHVGSRTLVDLELPPVLESVPYARDLVGEQRARAGAAQRRARRVELVTNAVKHGTGPVGLRVDADGTRVRIAVRDGGPALDPTRASTALDFARRADGYGLHIVERLAVATGVDRSPSGKTVWAELLNPAG
jgi:anti-sigma regulatory factor (Ser/Thr protein kinase)